MAEYYAVLSKAVAGLEANSPEGRRAVYDKARNALIGQLKAIDPPLPTAEISRQRLELEEAIRRVEREASAVPAGAPVKVAASRSSTAEPGATPPRQSPQDIFRRAIAETDKGSADAPRLERAPAAAKIDTSWASERIDRVPPPTRPAQANPPSQGSAEVESLGEGPQLAPDYDHEWDQNAPPRSRDYAGPRVGGDDRPGKAKRGGRRESRGDDHDTVERLARPSRLPTILLILLIVAMVGGLGALAWSQRAVITDLLSQFDSGSGTPTEQPAAATAATDTAGKDTDRLPGGEAAPTADARIVSPAAGAGGDATGQQVTAGGVLPNSQTANQDAVGADALVAQKAILYEEPLDAAAAAAGVVAINAAVTWSYVPNGINGPEIVGNVDVPERGMKIKLAIRRNTDSTLPASHVVEVVVDTPADFPGKSVREVPRIVLKPSEDARGQPLIGASAKVADGFFWIALSGVDSDVRANLGLLKDRVWIDLPLVYETGQRAILTFEKGTPGERVFERALTAWAG